jgi:hypothetical protein
MEKSVDIVSPLSKLPSELRLHIYSYTVPDVPLSVPPNEFTILNELEPKICKRSTDFSGWGNLTISRTKPSDSYL